jgi:hypothetical protein
MPNPFDLKMAGFQLIEMRPRLDGSARPMTARAGVDVVLAGHLHLADADDSLAHHPDSLRSILCIQAGTGTSNRRRLRHGNS